MRSRQPPRGYPSRRCPLPLSLLKPRLPPADRPGSRSPCIRLHLPTRPAEKENAAETLLMAKGFADPVVSITDGKVDVVINAGYAGSAWALSACISNQLIQHAGILQIYLEGRQIDTFSLREHLANAARVNSHFCPLHSFVSW